MLSAHKIKIARQCLSDKALPGAPQYAHVLLHSQSMQPSELPSQFLQVNLQPISMSAKGT